MCYSLCLWSPLGSGGSPGPLPTPRARERGQEADPPHPLADNALLEGVNVQMIDSTSFHEATPSPKNRRGPPPVAPYKPVPSTPTGDSTSPLPKPRGSIKRTHQPPAENGHSTPETSLNRSVPQDNVHVHYLV